MKDDFFNIEIENDGKIEDIKVMISIEKNLQVEDIVIMHNGKLLASDFATATAQGIKEDDILLLTTR